MKRVRETVRKYIEVGKEGSSGSPRSPKKKDAEVVIKKIQVQYGQSKAMIELTPVLQTFRDLKIEVSNIFALEPKVIFFVVRSTQSYSYQ